MCGSAMFVDVDPESKRVFMENGAILPYDSLIVAAGFTDTPIFRAQRMGGVGPWT